MKMTPIAHIHGGLRDFCFKGLVVTKSEMRTYDKGVKRRGRLVVVAGEMFVFTVRDHTGDIEVTVFDFHGAGYFFDKISLNSVYVFEHCRVFDCNDYDLTDHDYSLRFSSSSSVLYVNHGPCSYKPLKYSFQYIDDVLDEACIGAPVNILGVCVGDNGLYYVTRQQSGREVALREIFVQDQSGATVKVDLWEYEAKNFDSEDNPMVYVYGGRLKEFRGRLAIGTAMNTMLLVLSDNSGFRDLEDYREHLYATGEIS